MIRPYLSYLRGRGFGLAIALAGLVLVGACVGPAPVEDFALARSAQEAARDAEAVRYAPNLWYKAQERYKKAQVAFESRDYEEAKQSFIETRQMFEKAETTSRISRMQAGGVPQ